MCRAAFSVLFASCAIVESLSATSVANAESSGESFEDVTQAPSRQAQLCEGEQGERNRAQLGLLFLLVVVNALFAGSELALVTLREGQLQRLRPRAFRAGRWRDWPATRTGSWRRSRSVSRSPGSWPLHQRR